MAEANISREQSRASIEAIEEYLSYGPADYQFGSISADKFPVWRRACGVPGQLSPSVALDLGSMQVEHAFSLAEPIRLRTKIRSETTAILSDAEDLFKQASKTTGIKKREALLGRMSLPLCKAIVTNDMSDIERKRIAWYSNITEVANNAMRDYGKNGGIDDIPFLRLMTGLLLLNDPSTTVDNVYLPLPLRMRSYEQADYTAHMVCADLLTGLWYDCRIGRPFSPKRLNIDPVDFLQQEYPISSGQGTLHALITDYKVSRKIEKNPRYQESEPGVAEHVYRVLENVTSHLAPQGRQNGAQVLAEGSKSDNTLAWYRSLSPRLHPVVENREALDEAMNWLSAQYWAGELSTKDMPDLANMNLELADGLTAQKDSSAISYYEVSEDVFKVHTESTPERTAAHYVSRWASAAAFIRKVVSAQQFELDEPFNFEESHAWYGTELASMAYEVLGDADDPKTTTAQINTLAHWLTAALALADSDIPTIVVPASPRQQAEYGFDMLLYPQTAHETYLRGYTGRLRLRDNPDPYSLDYDTLTVTYEEMGQSSRHNFRVLRALMAKLTDRPYDESLIEQAKQALLPANLTAEL